MIGNPGLSHRPYLFCSPNNKCARVKFLAQFKYMGCFASIMMPKCVVACFNTRLGMVLLLAVWFSLTSVPYRILGRIPYRDIFLDCLISHKLEIIHCNSTPRKITNQNNNQSKVGYVKVPLSVWYCDEKHVIRSIFNLPPWQHFSDLFKIRFMPTDRTEFWDNLNNAFQNN